ncbi:Acetyl-CoA:oxalate CoA-transferase [Roseobacter fucihabitans]|uniref:Acetyl-CoA:oxalate CoA-transferase n=1 Tax=Roseobacter fucihabitans TaxID=1537242 RepID=A0ABZ2BXZ2_9RHOB|nr:CaiB/BaiF CoA-transferase family protein [Roseobacter litoralis]MBC6965178.1 Succinyl-CoA:(R)-benzylsuccinate CoA-transferase subunit BbsF [Roseobacter litoralis]MBC6965819.1 Succinyl-CoA:(R)-benzylsuccinate CoA-transferase subunit BbsF [Roseobacter litoralis]
MSGPLASLSVVEFSGLGPAPLAGQLLVDMGARVITIDRASAPADPTDINRRGKHSVALNLKSSEGRDAAKSLIAKADILIEGFRPGVMERLGLGPLDCDDHLIYGRMTGWGQEGALAQTAGHDINYLAMTGALHAIGPAGHPPVAPLNLVADYGGGAMFLIFGLLSALVERGISGKGQVVDAAMCDGVPAMMGLLHSLQAQGTWRPEREANWLDGGAPFYRCYECADGKSISVGALEPQFFAQLVEKAGLPHPGPTAQNDRARWATDREEFARVFKTKTRDAWVALFEGSDACVAPVLDFREAPLHPRNVERGGFYQDQNVPQASPAPRFSRSAPSRPTSPKPIGADTEAILSDLGYDAAEIARMRATGALT